MGSRHGATQGLALWASEAQKAQYPLTELGVQGLEFREYTLSHIGALVTFRVYYLIKGC